MPKPLDNTLTLPQVTSYDHVFEPLKIGPLVAKNRIEVAPADPFLASVDGLVTDELISYTAKFAKGGAAIVTVGDSPVEEEYGSHYRFTVNLSNPFVAHGLFKLVDAIHRYGALASIELNLRNHWEPADLTVDEIHDVIGKFVAAARRAADAGFDMIMIHGGHCHAVAQFFSPFFNKRTDEYGCGTMENRCRFANELLASVREAIGPNRAIEYRISGDDMLGPSRGVGVEEVLEFAKSIQDKIDLLHVSGGSFYDPQAMQYMIQSAYMPRATNLHTARYLHEHLDIPVCSVGAYTMELAAAALQDGAVDMVAMNRPFIADPDQVAKTKAGHPESIRPCIRCNNCAGEGPNGDCSKPLRCSVNAIAGREPFNEVTKAEASKRVAIVGGGCAGLEAARRLAERGHKPIVLEQEDHLGGMLLAAGANKLKYDVKHYAEWSIRTVEQNPDIEVRLGVAVTPEVLQQIDPDAVIVAVGSTPIVPNLPGVDKPHVMLGEDADAHLENVGERVVVVGAGLTGCETALMLAREGKQVTVVELRTQEACTSASINVGMIHSMLPPEGVQMMFESGLEEVLDDAVVVSHPDGTTESVPCDTVVLALGLRQRTDAVESLKGLYPETYVVGDCCTRGGTILTAVTQGFYAALNI